MEQELKKEQIVDVDQRIRPITIKTYYSNARKHMVNKIDATTSKLNRIELLNSVARDKVLNNKHLYLKDYGFDILKYKEFCDNKFIDGTFVNDVKILFDTDEKVKENKFALITILKYANTLKPINDFKRKLIAYNRISKMTLKEYSNYIKTYYTEVHKKLIVKGYGYEFPHKIGFLCINRCKVNTANKIVDFVATKANKQRMINAGIEIYDKTRHHLCEANGIPYNGQDYRIFRDDEYLYEFALCYPRSSGRSYMEVFKTADYRAVCIRGKTNQDLLIETNYNIDKILELDIDVRTKLYLSLESNKLLYTKFIRNDEQLSVHRQSDRKDR